MATKKKPSKQAVSIAVPYNEPKSVRIEKADNGFTVSTYTGNGCKQMVAKTETEAIRHAKKLLGSK